MGRIGRDGSGLPPNAGREEGVQNELARCPKWGSASSKVLRRAFARNPKDRKSE